METLDNRTVALALGMDIGYFATNIVPAAASELSRTISLSDVKWWHAPQHLLQELIISKVNIAVDIGVTSDAARPDLARC